MTDLNVHNQKIYLVTGAGRGNLFVLINLQDSNLNQDYFFNIKFLVTFRYWQSCSSKA